MDLKKIDSPDEEIIVISDDDTSNKSDSVFTPPVITTTKWTMNTLTCPCESCLQKNDPNNRGNIFEDVITVDLSVKSERKQRSSESLSTPHRNVSKARRVLDFALELNPPSQPEGIIKRKEQFWFLSSLSSILPENFFSHPEAQDYKKSYEKKKEELALRLFNIYNEVVFERLFPEDMPIKWNNYSRQFCGSILKNHFPNKNGRLVRCSGIILGAKILDRSERLRDVLIHEMCHAAAWVVNGVGEGHDQFWKNWANRARALFPVLPPITEKLSYEVLTKYIYRCTYCSQMVPRHSRSINILERPCFKCGGQFELLEKKPTKREGNEPEFHVTRARFCRPNKFALFLKDNFQRIRGENLTKSHQEVMKIATQLYRDLKRNSTVPYLE